MTNHKPTPVEHDHSRAKAAALLALGRDHSRAKAACNLCSGDGVYLGRCPRCQGEGCDKCGGGGGLEQICPCRKPKPHDPVHSRRH